MTLSKKALDDLQNILMRDYGKNLIRNTSKEELAEFANLLLIVIAESIKIYAKKKEDDLPTIEY